MADVKLFYGFLRDAEGGFCNLRADHGGPTYCGVTLRTLRRVHPQATVAELRKLPVSTWERIVKTLYWNVWQGDAIECQAVAEQLVDWLWTSGTAGIRNPQVVLGVVPDGLVGPATMRALRGVDPEVFCRRIEESRTRYFHRIVQRHPEQLCFLNGWLRRLHALTKRGEIGYNEQLSMYNEQCTRLTLCATIPPPERGGGAKRQRGLTPKFGN